MLKRSAQPFKWSSFQSLDLQKNCLFDNGLENPIKTAMPGKILGDI